jgi:hypothetical protein
MEVHYKQVIQTSTSCPFLVADPIFSIVPRLAHRVRPVILYESVSVNVVDMLLTGTA